MVGLAFDFKTGSILAVGATILIFVISTILPEGPVEKEGIH